MGLAERRKIKELEEEILPGRVKEIEEICGAPIPYEVDWESFDDFQALNVLDNLSCHRLNMALRMICQDDMGKEALQEGLKKIIIQNQSGACYGDTWSQLEGGTLTLDHSFTNMDYVDERTQGLVDTLEKGL